MIQGSRDLGNDPGIQGLGRQPGDLGDALVMRKRKIPAALYLFIDRMLKAAETACSQSHN